MAITLGISIKAFKRPRIASNYSTSSVALRVRVDRKFDVGYVCEELKDFYTSSTHRFTL